MLNYYYKGHNITNKIKRNIFKRGKNLHLKPMLNILLHFFHGWQINRFGNDFRGQHRLSLWQGDGVQGVECADIEESVVTSFQPNTRL